jgi:hypothetical protein
MRKISTRNSLLTHLLPTASDGARAKPNTSEQSVRGSIPRLRTLPFQNGQLLPKRQVFREQLAARKE